MGLFNVIPHVRKVTFQVLKLIKFTIYRQATHSQT